MRRGGKKWGVLIELMIAKRVGVRSLAVEAFLHSFYGVSTDAFSVVDRTDPRHERSIVIELVLHRARAGALQRGLFPIGPIHGFCFPFEPSTAHRVRELASCGSY